MYKFIDLDTGLPALLNKVKTWVTTKLSTKQDALVSGTNIKTINNESLVGSGNLTVQGLKGDKGDKGDTVVLDPEGLEQFEIINDLTTGGASNALSAEMGKELGGRMGAVEERLDDAEDSSHTVSIVGNSLVITTSNVPVVNVGTVSNDEVSCKAGNSATADFFISGRKLTSAVTITVSDNTYWSVSPSSISPSNGSIALTKVTITYSPAQGIAENTEHTCDVTVFHGSTTVSTISMTGTVAAGPTITLEPASLSISTIENTSATGVINVKGSALEGDIALSISGNGFTLSSNTVTKADAESAAGADITVTFDGSADGNATLTATSTAATNVTAAIAGILVSRKAAGETWDDASGKLTYTVLEDTTTVSVKQKSTSACTGAITIPATVYDNNNISYRVISLADNAFLDNTNITSVTMEDGGVEMLGKQSFLRCNALASLTLPNTLKKIGDPSFDSVYQNVIGYTALTRLTLPASLEYIAMYGIVANSSMTELEIKGMKANSAGGVIKINAIKANLVTVYTDIALKSTDNPLSVLPQITLASWGGSFLYGSIDGDSNTWNIYKDGNNVNQKITLVVPDAESVTAYNALRSKSNIGNVKGWGFFNIISK